MDPEWRCINPIEHRDVIPASYVSLPEGTYYMNGWIFLLGTLVVVNMPFVPVP